MHTLKSFTDQFCPPVSTDILPTGNLSIIVALGKKVFFLRFSFVTISPWRAVSIWNVDTGATINPLSLFSPGMLTVGEMLRNNSAFLADVQQHMNFSLVALRRLMDTVIPNNNLMVSQMHPMNIVEGNISLLLCEE